MFLFSWWEKEPLCGLLGQKATGEIFCDGLLVQDPEALARVSPRTGGNFALRVDIIEEVWVYSTRVYYGPGSAAGKGPYHYDCD